MEWFQIVSFMVSLLSIPTIAGLLWRDLHDRAKENSAQAKQKRKEESQNIIREVVRDEVGPLGDKVDSVSDRLDKVCEGTLCSLRNDILKCYYQCVAKGYRNDYDYQNVHDLYAAYEDLNGNSFIRDIMIRFDALPTKEEYKKQEVEHENGGNGN